MSDELIPWSDFAAGAVWPTPTLPERVAPLTLAQIKEHYLRLRPLAQPRELRCGSLDAVRRIAPERPMPHSPHAPGGLMGSALTGLPVVLADDLPRDVIVLVDAETGEPLARWTIPA